MNGRGVMPDGKKKLFQSKLHPGVGITLFYGRCPQEKNSCTLWLCCLIQVYPKQSVPRNSSATIRLKIIYNFCY